MNRSRFGSTSPGAIKNAVINRIPKNTTKTKTSIWRQFQHFCLEKSYELDASTPLQKIADILEDWAFNMKKGNGQDYKEYVVKTMWNTTAKMIQEKYFKEFNITFDPFSDIVFQCARDAKTTKRKQLQKNCEKRKQSSSQLTKEEIWRMMRIWNEETPEGLQKKFFHIASLELAWGGRDAVRCQTYHFRKERLTGRVEYNTSFSKAAQGGKKKCTGSKWLTANKEDPDVCPVRLLRKLLSKRNEIITTDNMFLTPNPFWNSHHGRGWFKNVAIGINHIAKWTKLSAEQIGINIQCRKITNNSTRIGAGSESTNESESPSTSAFLHAEPEINSDLSLDNYEDPVSDQDDDDDSGEDSDALDNKADILDITNTQILLNEVEPLAVEVNPECPTSKESELFGEYIAKHLQQLPFDVAFKLQSRIQTLVMETRLEYIRRHPSSAPPMVKQEPPAEDEPIGTSYTGTKTNQPDNPVQIRGEKRVRSTDLPKAKRFNTDHRGSENQTPNSQTTHGQHKRTECTVFAEHIALQLEKLPEELSLQLQSDIYELIIHVLPKPADQDESNGMKIKDEVIEIAPTQILDELSYENL